MLQPFTMQDAKKVKHTGRKKLPQHSLWSLRHVDEKRASAVELKDVPHSFKQVCKAWSNKGGNISVAEVGTFKETASGLVSAIEARLAANLKVVKKAGLQYPSDVAAYLTMREVDEKATAEVPGFRLKALDFGIKALLGGC